MNDIIERLLGSDKPYQRTAYGCAEWLKTYIANGAEGVLGKTPFETWGVVDIYDMIVAVKIAMDDMEAEWREECAADHENVTPEDMAHYCLQYLIKWFTLQNLNQLKTEHGTFKHCVDMVEPAEVIDLDEKEVSDR